MSLNKANAQGWDYFPTLGRVYYDAILTEKKNALDHKRKFYKLARFGIASCHAYLGYDRKYDSKYKKYFEKRGFNITNKVIHHEINGRIYLIDKAIHQLISHYGYIALLKM